MEKIDKWFERLLFAQKVNTAVTGIGLTGIGLAMMLQTYVTFVYHEAEMNEFKGMRVTQTVNNERPRNKEEVIEEIARRRESVKLQREP